MTTRTLIMAIAEYYKVSLVEASRMLHERTSDDDFEHVEDWYLNKIEEI